MKEFWKTKKIAENEDDLDVQLWWLEYEYALPKGFWTAWEWNDYHNRRRDLVDKIKEELSDSRLQLGVFD